MGKERYDYMRYRVPSLPLDPPMTVPLKRQQNDGVFVNITKTNEEIKHVRYNIINGLTIIFLRNSVQLGKTVCRVKVHEGG